MKKKTYTIDNLFKAINREEGIGCVKNMMEKDGGLQKRPGWRVIASFMDEDLYPLRINGIFEFDARGKSCLVVHAGTYLFECDHNFQNRKRLSTTEGVVVEDRRTQGYMYQDLLWICGMGELAIFDGEGVFGIYEHPLPFVPTTSISIHDDWLSVTPKKSQEENRLTNQRKNSFIGSKGGYADQSFFLDGRAKYGEPFSLTAKFRVKRRKDYANSTTSHYSANDENGNPLNTVAVASVYTSSLTEEKYFLTDGVRDIYGRMIDILDYDESQWYIQVINGNELYLSFSCPTYEEGRDNIFVEYVNDTPKDEALKQTDHFAIANTSSGKSIMLLCQGGNELLYTDKEKGFSYFPKENLITIGNKSSKIRGILPMANNYIGIFKDEEFFKVLINGNKSGNYTVFSTSNFYGVYNPFLVKRLETDCITVSKKGVFGLCHEGELGQENITFYKRSSQIEKELLSHSETDFRGATSAVLGNDYYLFVGDRAYVANSQSKYYKNGKMGDEFEYRWCIFESCPCYSAAVIKDTLYMGREDGCVAIFDGGYTDRDVSFALQRDQDVLWSFEEEGTKLFFNEHLHLQDQCQATFDEHYALFSTCTYNAKDGVIKIPIEALMRNGEMGIFEGDYVLVTSKETYGIFEGRVLKTNPSDGTIIVNSDFDNEGEGLLYIRRYANEEYTLTKNGDNYLVKKGKERIVIFEPLTYNVYIREEKPIYCLIKTSPLDLGTWEGKNLYEIDVTPVPHSKGDLQIGYETEKNVFKKEISLGSYLALDYLDLNLFSFKSSVKENVRLKCFERNFDYIVLTLESFDSDSFGIEKIALKYTQ